MKKKYSNAPKNILYIFIDGIGLGKNDKAANPFARFKTHFFSVFGGKESFPENGILIPTNAAMGVSGIPQSATGQTALFTGYNGSKIMGRHVNGFPTFTLRPYLKEKSILKSFNDIGKSAKLLNSYTDWFLKKLNHPKKERFMSASTTMQFACKEPFFTIDDYIAGKSLYMDITNWFLRKMGLKINLTSPKSSGRKAAQIARKYDLSIYEYFFTDKVGHAQSMAAAKRIIPHIEGFLEGLWEEINPDEELVIIASDHGNMENLSKKLHTTNYTGTIVYGKGQDFFKDKVKYLYDIPRTIYDLYGMDFKPDILIENKPKNHT